MGVNCSATLNPKADWRTVGLVASILLGDEPVKKHLDHSSWSTESKRFGYGKLKPTSSPEYVDIIVQGDPDNPVAKLIADSDELPYPMWYGLESKSLYPHATAAKIALTVAITKFFGGSVILNDCSGLKRSYKAPAYIGAEDGKPWQRLQQAIFDLKPLTLKDVAKFAKYAAYEQGLAEKESVA